MIEDKFKNKYRVQSNRLQGYDYGTNGYYFVTICTQNRVHYFGEIINAKMQLSEIGKIAEKFWLDIPNHYLFVILDQFVIMPNHIHGILIFNKNNGPSLGKDAIYRVSSLSSSTSNDNLFTIDDISKNGGITHIHNPMLHANLGHVIRWFKGRVSFESRSYLNFAWLGRFHDRIIRDDDGFEAIRKYIFNNPQNWDEDEFNDKNITSGL